MKKYIFLFVLMSTFGWAQQTKVFTQKLEKAESEHKKVLLYFSGSDWCAPCIKFKKFMVDTKEFQSYANSNLIIYNADFPRLSKNKLTKDVEGENEILAEKYNPKGLFPLILLLDSKGKVLKKWEGYPTESVKGFIDKMKD